MTKNFALTVLGSGSILSEANRNCSGYLLEAGTKKIVIDFGPGALKALQKTGETFLSVNDFFFTHFDHPDHVNDFVALISARYVAFEFKVGKPKTLNVVAPKGFKNFLKKIKGVYPFLKKLPFKVLIKEISNSKFKFNGVGVVSRKVKHTKTSIGYRFSFKGKTISYSGDTGYCKEIVELCKNTDLAILECSIKDSSKPLYHLNAKACGKIAKESTSKALLLTHIYPFLEKMDLKKSAKKEFKGKILVAEDGMVLKI